MRPRTKIYIEKNTNNDGKRKRNIGATYYGGDSEKKELNAKKLSTKPICRTDNKFYVHIYFILVRALPVHDCTVSQFLFCLHSLLSEAEHPSDRFFFSDYSHNNRVQMGKKTQHIHESVWADIKRNEIYMGKSH